MTTEQQAEAAMKRMRKYINRSAGQHVRAMRASFCSPQTAGTHMPDSIGTEPVSGVCATAYTDTVGRDLSPEDGCYFMAAGDRDRKALNGR